MQFLLIDTATAACHVGVSINNQVVNSQIMDAPFKHAEWLTVLIGEAMKSAGLDFTQLSAVVITGGPGSYTGLRIGASVAKGICFGHSLPLIALNTLETMAHGFCVAFPNRDNGSLLIPMIDARRMEVFTGVYTNQVEALQPPGPLILDEKSYSNFTASSCHFFGDGATKFSTLNAEAGKFYSDFFLGPHAMLSLAKKRFLLGQFEPIAYYRPDYHKDFYSPDKK
jgi:tRNA threonylcarbamoyladenosine biosynthesis protein TsaB